MKKKRAILLTVAGIMVFSITSCGTGTEKATYKFDESEMPKVEDANSDINVSKLQDAAENIKNLDLSQGAGNDSVQESTETAKENDTQTSETQDEPAGEKTSYSFVDVTRTDKGLYMVANGGMNGSTVLFAGKDRLGLLDYVDNTVLEKGRTINRDMLYDQLAYMLVDDELSADEEKREKHLMMALAVANNFHDVDVNIKSCVIDANNAADYHYNLTAYGAEDTWLVNYQDCKFYMHDGATEYFTDMFKDEYLAVWLFAIEDYYGIKIR